MFSVSVTYIRSLGGGCTSHKSLGIVYRDSSAITDAIRIDNWELLDFHNEKLVEIEGIYRHGFEMDAIFQNENSNEKKDAVWLEFTGMKNLMNPATQTKLLDKNFTELNKFYNRRIRIVGFFNKENKGHMDLYFGSIGQIRYLELMK